MCAFSILLAEELLRVFPFFILFFYGMMGHYYAANRFFFLKNADGRSMLAKNMKLSYIYIYCKKIDNLLVSLRA